MAGVHQYSWPVRFGRQFAILLKKNVILHFRNRRSLILRLAAPFFFMLLLWLTDKAIQSDNSSQQQYRNIRQPEADVIDAIPSCETDLYFEGKKPCYDFVYSPIGDPAVEAIVTSMREASGIPAAKVLGFPSKAATDTWLLANFESTNNGVHFAVNGSDISFSLQTNDTVKYFKGDFQNVNTKFQLPVQLAAHRAVVEYQLQRDGQSVDLGDVSMSDFAHPAGNTLSVVSAAGGPFLYAACMFGFIVQLGNIVMEREVGLKESLRGMGMLDSAYNASWAVWELLMALASSLVIIVSGYIFQFNIWLDNNFFVTFFLILLFQFAMTALAFTFAPLVKKSFQAVYLGFGVFLLGWLMQIVVVFGVPYKPSYKNDALYVIFSLFPWTLFYKGILDLGTLTSGTSSSGISWSDRSSYCKEEKQSDFATGCNSQVDICECVMPLGEIYGVLIGQYFLWLLVGLYLDAIIPNGGIAKRPWFFLSPGFWVSKRTTKRAGKGAAHDEAGAIALNPVKHDFSNAVAPSPPEARSAIEASREEGLATVAQERDRMRAKLEERPGQKHVFRNVAKAADDAVEADDRLSTLEVFGLQKVFPGRGGCFKRRTGDFWAVRGSWFSIEEGTIFCLLGANGAGKSTTINCLTGMTEPTGGDAVICGAALSAPAGMDHIRARMGVCPQFDVLWDELTSQEHLEVFAWVKGMAKHDIRDLVAASLAQVNLTSVRNARVSTYSGGMKRRLSVAIALLGDPEIVYLDEPTTGMDALSRRAVWDIIEASKKGRAIVLTTHSMEEADILGDRIGIMARGALRVVGTSIALKRIFGSGYQLTINFNQRGNHGNGGANAGAAEAVKAVFRDSLGLAPVEETPLLQMYLVPQAKQPQLAAVLDRLAAMKEQIDIREPQVAMSSLEEVFLSIARQAEMEAADGTTLAYTDAQGTVLQVPVGADTVLHPGSGDVCKVVWGQDAAGALQIVSVTPVAPAEVEDGYRQPLLGETRADQALVSA